MALGSSRNLLNGDLGCMFWNAETWQPDGGSHG